MTPSNPCYRFLLSSFLAFGMLCHVATASLVVNDPPIDLGGPAVSPGSVPRVDDGDVLYHVITATDVLNGQIYFQFESNENDASIDLRLSFYQDPTPDGTLTGDDVLFFDFDTSPGDLTLDSLQTLSAATNQTTFEWTISGILAADEGTEISIDVDIADQSNGFERAQFSQVSIAAVPEPSQILLGGLLCTVLGAVKSGTRRRSRS